MIAIRFRFTATNTARVNASVLSPQFPVDLSQNKNKALEEDRMKWCLCQGVSQCRMISKNNFISTRFQFTVTNPSIIRSPIPHPSDDFNVPFPSNIWHSTIPRSLHYFQLSASIPWIHEMRYIQRFCHLLSSFLTLSWILLSNFHNLTILVFSG